MTIWIYASSISLSGDVFFFSASPRIRFFDATRRLKRSCRRQSTRSTRFRWGSEIPMRCRKFLGVWGCWIKISWWCQTFFFVCPENWGNDSIWLIFFRLGWNHQPENSLSHGKSIVGVLFRVCVETPCKCVFFVSGFQILHIGFPTAIMVLQYKTQPISPCTSNRGLSHPGWRQQRQREDEDGQWRVGFPKGWFGRVALASSFGRFVSN